MELAGCLFHLLLIFLVFLTIFSAIFADDPSTWPGHLEPLGSQQRKESLETIYEFPSPKEFFAKYVSQIKPVFIKGGAKLSPGFEKWTDEYFMSLPESKKQEVFAEKGKKENRSNPGDDMSFYEFVKTYKEKDIYMVNGVLPFLQKDVVLPPSLVCDEITRDKLVDTVMWFSSGGTKSVLHNDDVDNINCLFSGRKELLFIEYSKYKKKVLIDHPVGGYSGVDVDKVDFTKYPGLHDVTYYNVTMEKGDCLFIPYKWFHQVRSYDRNIAVNVWWTHIPDFVPSQCDQVKNKDIPTLDQFHFSALAANGAVEEQGPTDLVDYFSKFLSEANNNRMELEAFIDRMRNDRVLTGNGRYTWNDRFSSVAQRIVVDPRDEVEWICNNLDDEMNPSVMFEAVDINKDGVYEKSDKNQFESHLNELTDKLENYAAEIEDLIEDQNEPKLKDKNEQENRDEL